MPLVAEANVPLHANGLLPQWAGRFLQPNLPPTSPPHKWPVRAAPIHATPLPKRWLLRSEPAAVRTDSAPDAPSLVLANPPFPPPNGPRFEDLWLPKRNRPCGNGPYPARGKSERASDRLFRA